MKRSDIIRTIQVQFKRMRTKDAKAILDAVIEEMKTSVADDNRIEIRGFGTFQPRTRAAKNGYNPTTGEVRKKTTLQGYNDDSVWARGQAWGLYGYTLMYRYTHEFRYLQQAQQIAF